MITRVLPLVRAHPGQSALAFLAAIGTIAAGIGLMSSSSYLISWAALRPPILDMMLVIVAVRFFALSRAACRYAERLLSHDLTFKWLMLLRVRVYRMLEPLLPNMLLTKRSGDLLGRMSSDVDMLQNDYLRVALPALTAFFIVGMTVALLHIFSPWLAWATFIFLFLDGVALPWWNRRYAKGWGRDHAERQSALSAKLVETIQGLRELSMLNSDTKALHDLCRLNDEMTAIQKRYATTTGLQEAYHLWCAHGSMLAALTISIPLVVRGDIPGIFLALIALAVMTSFEAVQAMGAAFLFHEQTTTAAQQIAEFESPYPPAKSSIHVTGGAKDITFKNVSLEYDNGPVLQHISFTWKAGERIALVGPSGGGKSSVAHMLLKFQEPTAGVISIGDQCLAQANEHDVRMLFSVIPQHVHVFNDTVRANLCLAQPDADDQALWHALEMADLATMVRQLPDGLDTFLGEQGARFSGGERQRLGVARVWLKKAPYCIWDEPTAHIDPISAKQIMQRLLQSGHQGKSLLWITHQLVAMDQMDHIYVLHKGQIVESGLHGDLLSRNGYYARMVRLQNQMLRT
jgi:ATP-binding cassette, subfamily C, bacterial CydC